MEWRLGVERGRERARGEEEDQYVDNDRTCSWKGERQEKLIPFL